MNVNVIAQTVPFLPKKYIADFLGSTGFDYYFHFRSFRIVNISKILCIVITVQKMIIMTKAVVCPPSPENKRHNLTIIKL